MGMRSEDKFQKMKKGEEEQKFSSIPVVRWWWMVGR